MFINSYFPTVVWSEEKPEFVKSLNKASDKYIKASKKMPEGKKYLKQFGDFGRSWHSTPLLNDNDFLDLRNYVGQKSWEFLDHHGDLDIMKLLLLGIMASTVIYIYI